MEKNNTLTKKNKNEILIENAHLIVPLNFKELMKLERFQDLIQSLPPDYVYLSLKEYKNDDLLLDVLPFLSPDQFKVILDIDCWNKDHLEESHLSFWFQKLLSVKDHPSFMQKISSLDWTLILEFFQQNVEVAFFDREKYYELDERTFFSPDYLYQITFKKNENIQLIIEFIDELYKQDISYVRQLLGEVSWRLANELEDSSYYEKKNRLLENGICDYYDSVEIMTYLSPSLALSRLQNYTIQKIFEINTIIVKDPVVYESNKEELFIKKILSSMKDVPVIAYLEQELLVTLKMYFQFHDGLRAENEKLNVLSKRAWYLINLGLEYLSNNKTETAVEILKTVPVKTIFRVGNSILTDILNFGRRILSTYHIAEKGPNYLLGSKINNFIENLISHDPLFTDLGNEASIGPACSAFYKLEHMAKTYNNLGYLDFLYKFFLVYAPINKVDLSSIGKKELNKGKLELNLFTLFMTALINNYSGKGFSIVPIDLDDFNQFLKKQKQNVQAETSFEEYIRSQIEQIISRVKAPPTAFPERLAGEIIGIFKSDLLPLDASGKIDPRFIECVWLKQEQK